MLYYIALIAVIVVVFVRIQRLFPLFVITFSLVMLCGLYTFGANTLAIWLIAVVLLWFNLLLLVPWFRLFIIRPILKKFVKKMPALISATERIAMESGDTHWEGQLFSNQLRWNQLLSVKTKPLSAQEQDFIEVQVPKLCDIFNQFGLAKQTLAYIKSAGFWSFSIPAEYGGLDFSAQAHSKILTQLSSCDASLAVTVMVPNSLGPAQLIVHYGSNAQKQDLLPKLATGEHIPCFALTSSNAGSDAGAMIDSGIVCEQDYQGENTLGIRLNWDKRYTTLAPIATLIGLAFKTYDPDGLMGDKPDLGITCALVDSSLHGVSIGRHHHPIGSGFSNGPHQGKDVFIPMSAVIGGQMMVGRGWSMLMECLSIGRGISLPSLSMAGVQLSLKTSIEYALVRKQFKQSLHRFQGVGEKIVAMAADTVSMQAMSNFHLDLLDQGLNPSVSSAILKYHHTELLRTNVNHAMDIHAGKTVMLGKSNYLSNLYQVIPVAITVEGANILTRSMMIFGQGLMRCHPFLKDELEALTQKDYGLFNRLLGTHISHQVHIGLKSFVFALGGAYFADIPADTKGFKKRYYRQLSRLSANFAFLVEVLMMKYAANIKFQESINGMFADLLMNMYGISTLLKYSENLNHNFDDLIRWRLQQQLNKSQTLLNNICHQFRLSPLLKLLVLPTGINQPPPNISLQNKVIRQLVEDIDIKNALTNDVICSEFLALEELEQAYTLALKAEDIYKRVGYVDSFDAIDALLDEAKINTKEHQLLLDLTQLRQKVLKVDDYED